MLLGTKISKVGGRVVPPGGVSRGVRGVARREESRLRIRRLPEALKTTATRLRGSRLLVDMLKGRLTRGVVGTGGGRCGRCYVRMAS